MRRIILSLLWIAVALANIVRSESAHAALGTLADSNGQIVGWGDNSKGQLNVPSGTYTAIDAGEFHNLGIKSDGTLAGWGDNAVGETTVPGGTFTAISAGYEHSLGIKSDGTLAGWGDNVSGETTVPSGTFTAISAGAYHSLGIKSDGTLTGWGLNTFGETTVPSGTFTAISASGYHSLGIKSDGTLAGWGFNTYGEATVPGGAFTAIAAGDYHSLGIKSDGTLAGWGYNNYGQATVPGGTFTAIAGGYYHSLGIKSDGTLAGWGSNASGQTNVPSGAFVAVSAGDYHSLALPARTSYDGDLLVNYTGSANGPNGLKANLNRSVTVAGNALIQSPMYLYNNPLMSVAGKVSFSGSGSVIGTGTIAASGGLEIASGAALIVPSTVAIGAAGPLMGGGALVLGSGANVTVGLSNVSAFTGSIGVNSGAVLSFIGTGYTSPSYIDNYTGGNIRLTAGQRLAVGSAAVGVNYGEIDVLGNGNVLGGTAELDIGSSFYNFNPAGLITGHDSVMRFNGAGLVNQGSLALTGGTNDVFGKINNDKITGVNGYTGSIVVTGGATATFYDDVIQNGTMKVSNAGSTTSKAIFLGAFSGSSITGGGDLFFEGDLRPGNSPAPVTFNNNVSLDSSASLQIELGGTTPGTQYDKVQVTGSLSLDGKLQVSLINSFTPARGNKFDLLSWGALNGTFSSLQLPALGGSLVWSAGNLYRNGSLSVVDLNTLPGDFNRDHQVTGADLPVMLQALTNVAGYEQQYHVSDTDFGIIGDLDGSGAVNNADIQAMLDTLAHGTNFIVGSAPAPNAAPVPEPAAFALAALGFVGLGFAALRKNNRQA